jgi:hypothetical protein
MPVKGHTLSEEELEIALILKVAKFSVWPDKKEDSFNFCLYRGKGYQKVVMGLTEPPIVKGRPVNFVFIKDSSRFQFISLCDLLFVTEAASFEVKQVLHRAAHAPTLTLGSFPGFVGLGGMIELKKQSNRYGFEIDLLAVRNSGIELSASLLEISTIVNGGR